jgi:hypothetical protein
MKAFILAIVLTATIWTAPAFASMYRDLGGAPGRFIFACQEKAAMDVAVNGLEHNNMEQAKPYFQARTCALLMGKPVDPSKLTASDAYTLVKVTEDADGQTVHIYRVQFSYQDEPIWAAVWISEYFGASA